MISIRPAVAGDAQYIGAVFDAAVREGWALRSAGCREAFLYTHEKNQRALRSMKPAGIGAMGPFENRIFAAFTCGSRGW